MPKAPRKIVTAAPLSDAKAFAALCEAMQGGGAIVPVIDDKGRIIARGIFPANRFVDDERKETNNDRVAKKPARRATIPRPL